MVAPYWPWRCPSFVGRRFFFRAAFGASNHIITQCIIAFRPNVAITSGGVCDRKTFNQGPPGGFGPTARHKVEVQKVLLNSAARFLGHLNFRWKAPEKPWQLVVQFFPFKLSSFWKPFVFSNNNWIRGHGGFFRVLTLSLPNPMFSKPLKTPTLNSEKMAATKFLKIECPCFIVIFPVQPGFTTKIRKKTMKIYKRKRLSPQVAPRPRRWRAARSLLRGPLHIQVAKIHFSSTAGRLWCLWRCWAMQGWPAFR